MILKMNYNKSNNSIKRRYSKVIARKKRKKRIKKKRRTKKKMRIKKKRNLLSLLLHQRTKKKKKMKLKKRDTMKIRIQMIMEEKMLIMKILCFTLTIQKNKMNCIKKLIGLLQYRRILK